MLESSSKTDRSEKTFIPAHKNFRVIAIAAPVPPYTGYPIDPPFRSRFQSRFVDPVGALLTLASAASRPADAASSILYDKLQEIVLSTQYASESQSTVDATAKSTIRPFPQSALAKLRLLLSTFPVSSPLSPEQLAKLVLVLHPGLLYAPFVVWGLLSRQTEDAGLGPLGSPSLNGEDDESGLLAYRLAGIQRETERTICISFTSSGSSPPVDIVVPGGPRPLLEFPWKDPNSLDFLVTGRFMGLLTCMLQAHAIGWDITYVPPVLPSTASCSTSLLVRTFGALLGYEVESVHMYKELGGRELIMRRKVDDGGATSWEPR